MIETIKALVLPEGKSLELWQPATKKQFLVRFSLAWLVSILLFGFYGYFGIGTELYSEQLGVVKESRLESAKAIYFIGKILAGILFPFVYTFFFTVLFWIVCEEETFGRVWKLQLVPLVITLIGKIVELPTLLILRLPEHSSPFGLGVLTQIWTNQIFIVELLSSLTIFSVWAGFMQYIIFHKGEGIGRNKTLFIVIVSNILYILLISATDTFFRSMKVWL